MFVYKYRRVLRSKPCSWMATVRIHTRLYLEEEESQIHVKMIEITLQHGHGTWTVGACPPTISLRATTTIITHLSPPFTVQDVFRPLGLPPSLHPHILWRRLFMNPSNGKLRKPPPKPEAQRSHIPSVHWLFRSNIPRRRTSYLSPDIRKRNFFGMGEIIGVLTNVNFPSPSNVKAQRD